MTFGVVLYTPNVIGYARLLLTLVSLVAAARAAAGDGGSVAESAAAAAAQRPVLCWIYLAAVLAAAALDAVDGWAARRLGQTSTFGAQLDVVCDNALRSSCWVVATLAEPRVLPISVAVLCLEWLTLLATQSAPGLEERLAVALRAHAASAGGQRLAQSVGRKRMLSWRETAQTKTHPWLVRAYFANGFRNPIGALGIASLFFAPLHVSASAVLEARGGRSSSNGGSGGGGVLEEHGALWASAGVVLHCGRALSACIELYFVRRHAAALLAWDEHERVVAAAAAAR